MFTVASHKKNQPQEQKNISFAFLFLCAIIRNQMKECLHTLQCMEHSATAKSFFRANNLLFSLRSIQLKRSLRLPEENS